MDITEVRVYLTSGNGPTKAFASVTFDDAFVVKDIRLIDGKKGYFISMPSRKDKNGDYRDICHPINNETRNLIYDAVMDKYEQEKSA